MIAVAMLLLWLSGVLIGAVWLAQREWFDKFVWGELPKPKEPEIMPTYTFRKEDVTVPEK